MVDIRNDDCQNSNFKKSKNRVPNSDFAGINSQYKQMLEVLRSIYLDKSWAIALKNWQIY